MRIYKPLRVSVAPRVVEVGTKPLLVVSGLLYFPLDRPDCLLGEQALWATVGAEIGQQTLQLGPSVDAAQQILDEGLPKACGEVVVRGYAYPAGGPNVGCRARLLVDRDEQHLVDKTVVVSGDREWEFLGMTAPKPFDRVALTWTRAFGGPGFVANPAGRGIASMTLEGGKIGVPLPNVEHPSHLVKAKGDRPMPVSFAPIDPSWQPRASKMGTFDQTWLERDYPGMPVDLDLRAYQAAQEDQWIKGFFGGGERVVMEHMHPTIPRLEARLPTFKVRALLHMKGAPTSSLRDLSTRVDTVILLPHLMRGIVVHRAVAEIEEDDAFDVETLMVAVEAADAPRDMAYYRDRLEARLDKRRGALVSISEADLEPKLPRYDGDDVTASSDATAAGGDIRAFLKTDQLLQKHMQHGAAKRHAELVGQIVGAGLDPKDFGVPLDPPGQDLPAWEDDEDPLEAERVAVAEEREAELAEERKQAAESQARALCEANGFDFDAMIASGEGGGPPTYTAEGELQKLRDGVAEAERAGVKMTELARRAEDPLAFAQMVEQEKRLKDAYRSGAHILAPAKMPTPEKARELRARIEIAAKAANDGPLFHDVDLTGADLSNVVLRGIDLSGAFLERAKLAGADLTGANLRGAVLARADLRGAKLAGADLTGANLGEADVAECDLTGATLERVVLFRTKLDRARLVGARVAHVDAWEATGDRPDFSGAIIEHASFIQVKIQGMNASGAKLTEVVFLDSVVPDIDLAGATGESVSFVKTIAERAVLRRANVKQLRVVGESMFGAADFTMATVPSATLRGTALEDAKFLGADLRASDLGEIRATRADFRSANLTESVLMRGDLRDADLSGANLLDAILQKAKLGGAKFEGANAFQADFAGSKGDDRTSFAGANVGRVRKTRTRS